MPLHVRTVSAVCLAGFEFDVSKDAGFLIPIQTEQTGAIAVVTNWQAGLKK